MNTHLKKQIKKISINWTSELTFERIKMILMSMDVEEEYISENRNFYEDFYFDSLSYMNLIVLIEHYFGIVIEDNLAEKIHTVAELQTVVYSKIHP
ncbi:acyl carrier protein [Bernardetia sp. Wsw4-3y2]|uniref:acyl carrier protein n=1 Tax=Bernardetia sp. Wsw4-3y2 TaxID=3127471 RepID=UPI0030D1900E